MILKYYIIQFIIVTLVAFLLNPNILLINRYNDIYYTLTNLYIALIISSNVLWTHQIIMYLTYHKINIYLVIIGLILSLIFFYLLRQQKFVNKRELSKRLIIKNSSTIKEIDEYIKKIKKRKYKKRR